MHNEGPVVGRGNPLQPLLDLRLFTPRLGLRLPTDDELVELGHLAADGIHPPGKSPFLSNWSEQPRQQLVAGLMQSHWRKRAEWSRTRWELIFAVFVGEQIIGAQSLRADNFPALSQVDTGSWLGLAFQGRGYGKEMRAAVLALAFEGLGAQSAVSDAFVSNPSSNAVSRALGYQHNGISRSVVRGKAQESNRYLMTQQMWQISPARDVGTSVLVSEEAQEMLGSRRTP